MSAQSSVNGDVSALRVVRPAQVTASASVTGRVTLLIPIRPATVLAASHVVASLAALRRIGASGVAATSTVYVEFVKFATDGELILAVTFDAPRLLGAIGTSDLLGADGSGTLVGSLLGGSRPRSGETATLKGAS